MVGAATGLSTAAGQVSALLIGVSALLIEMYGGDQLTVGRLGTKLTLVLALASTYVVFSPTASLFLDAAAAPSQQAKALPVAQAKLGAQIKPGVDVLLEERLDLLHGKRVGLLTHAAAVDRRLRNTADLLAEHPKVKLVALFAPEHGLRGDVPAGDSVASYVDAITGIPVHSLYGKARRPTPAMLKGVDLLLVDLQDVGIRSYTYISTMAYAMEAAKAQGIPVVVLDRPNPLGGHVVEGPVAQKGFLSFVGIYPIPVRHGLTIGELARMFNDTFGIGAKLDVIPMRGWRREMMWWQTGLPWVPTSPHIPTSESALLFGATGLTGETNLSDGVGTANPFAYVGAKWVDPQLLASELNDLGLPGVLFRATYFRPFGYRYAGQSLGGVQIHLTAPAAARVVEMAVHILAVVQRLWPGKLEIVAGKTNQPSMFDLVAGTDGIRKGILQGKQAAEIMASWQPALRSFMEMRKRYLLY